MKYNTESNITHINLGGHNHSRYIILLIMLFAAIPYVNAQSASMPLLAVSDVGGGRLVGSVATMSLRIESGEGRVFIDSYPLTKIDTQLSTRFAQRTACKYLEIDCSKYDFFYTIRSPASIVGGPSAGAATTLLTLGVLDEKIIPEGVAITGTINSGGIIGPVAGVKEKIGAAVKSNISRIIIPSGNGADANISVNADIIEVSTLDEVVLKFFGSSLRNRTVNWTLDESYLSLMDKLSIKLCNRSDALLSRFTNITVRNDILFTNVSRYDELKASILREEAVSAYRKRKFYTAASRCFGANVLYGNALLIHQNNSLSQLVKSVNRLLKRTKSFDAKVSNWTLYSIRDLETYLIVKERILETEDTANKIIVLVQDNNLSNASKMAVIRSRFSYAIERLNSADSWSKFYNLTGGIVFRGNITSEDIRMACVESIGEADERYQYVSLFMKGSVGHIKKGIESARDAFNEGDFAFCLFLANKAKADSNAILSTLGVGADKAPMLVEEKLRAAERSIAESTAKGNFPILGYSYYELAKSLTNSSLYSALTYAEYSLEFSNLQIYQSNVDDNLRTNNFLLIKPTPLFYVGSGFILGLIVCRLLSALEKRKRRRRRRMKYKKLT